MEHYSKPEPICPHCQKEIGIDEHELYHLYNSDDNHEIECPECEKIFWVNPIAKFTFSTNTENEF